MDGRKDALSRVGVVGHEEFDALGIDVIGALHVVGLRNVGQAISETLSVQVFLGVVRLMLNHVERNHDVFKASLFAAGC